MQHNSMSRRIAGHISAWIAFSAMLVWGWRVWDIFNKVPGYNDVLEIAWGINWYYDSLFVRHVSPGFTSMVFHPLGWHVFTFGYPPLIFLTALPLTFLGGIAFAYNVLALASIATRIHRGVSLCPPLHRIVRGLRSGPDLHLFGLSLLSCLGTP